MNYLDGFVQISFETSYDITYIGKLLLNMSLLPMKNDYKKSSVITSIFYLKKKKKEMIAMRLTIFLFSVEYDIWWTSCIVDKYICSAKKIVSVLKRIITIKTRTFLMPVAHKSPEYFKHFTTSLNIRSLQLFLTG